MLGQTLLMSSFVSLFGRSEQEVKMVRLLLISSLRKQLLSAGTAAICVIDQNNIIAIIAENCGVVLSEAMVARLLSCR